MEYHIGCDSPYSVESKSVAGSFREKVIDVNSVDSKDIKKHKNDIYRLTKLLTADEHIVLPEEIQNDIRELSDQSVRIM